jgi:hypothetical protein
MFKNQFADGIFLSGIEGGRTLLPPMLWNDFAYMTDEDTKAMFAYFKTIKSVAMLSLWLLLRLI